MKFFLWVKSYPIPYLAFFCFFLGIFNSYPQDFTPKGLGILIPGYFGGITSLNPSFLFSDDPRASSLNPASMADRELPVFGFSLVPALSIDEPLDSSLFVSGFTTTPTPLGTATLLLDGGDSGFGFYGATGYLGISKRSSSDLSFGIGLGAVFLGANKDVYGLTVSLGAQRTFKELGQGGSKLSFSVLALGSPLSPLSSTSPVMAPTPLITFSTGLIESSNFSLSIAGMAGMPNFTDVITSMGISLGFGHDIAVDLSWSNTLSNVFSSAPQNYFQPIPSIFLNMNTSPYLKYSSYGTALAFARLTNIPDKHVFETALTFSKGNKDTIGPNLNTGPLEAFVFSSHFNPNIVIPLSIKDSSRIAAWNLNVYDSAGTNVYKIGDGFTRNAEPTGLFSIKKVVNPPMSVLMPLDLTFKDGEYRIRTWAVDEWGNASRSRDEVVHIDSTPPDAIVQIEGQSICTPNGDGIRDQITLIQNGSRENLWTGTFLDDTGHPVRSFEWTDGPPISFSWDGKDAYGKPVADGIISYTLKSTDAALNHTEVSVSPIIVDSKLPSIHMSLSSNVLQVLNEISFQPLKVTMDVPIKDGLLDWKFQLRSSDNDSVFRMWEGSREGLDVLPSNIIFDGRNLDGDLITDGSYRFYAQLNYSNGNAPYAATETFIVDRTRPKGRIRANSTVLVPDEGNSILLYHDLSPNAEWMGTISNSRGDRVITFPLGKTTEPLIEWYGISADGDSVEDGIYVYTASGLSPSGVIGITEAIEIKVESSGVDLALLADKRIFSARIGTSGVRLISRMEKRESIISYELGISTFPEKKPVRTFTGFGSPPGSILWDGYDEAGKRSLDGMYFAELVLRFDGGIETRSEPISVQLDSTIPEATLKLSSRIFSPNADGKLDSIEISQSAKAEEWWEGYILNDQDMIARAYTWKGIPPSSISWDGRDEKGAIFPDGKYRYRLYSLDAAGNQGLYETDPIMLDTRVPNSSIQIDKTAFSPNSDSFADFINIRVSPSFIDGIVSWELTIVDSANVQVKILASSGNILTEKRWDGHRVDGSLALDGIYKARINLNYEKGDQVHVESNPFRLDTTPPKVFLRLSPLPFSPDDDNENDELSFSLQATDESSVVHWFMTILDPEGHPFTVFSGSTLPKEPIYWDGLDLDGNLVEAAQEYSYELTVQDALGNKSRVFGTIPIDVFVIRDGDRMKIRISSIVFEPNTAKMQTTDMVSSNRNAAVLDRIAVVLAKFPSYRIRIEGHAVNISGTEREERNELEPLSLARAQTVSDALVERGVPRTSLESKGLGGREPLVPHGDTQNRWRNRRVEFILVK